MFKTITNTHVVLEKDSRKLLSTLWSKWIHPTDDDPIHKSLHSMMNTISLQAIENLQAHYAKSMDEHIKLNKAAVQQVLNFSSHSGEAQRILSFLSEKDELLQEDKEEFMKETRRIITALKENEKIFI